MVPGGLGKGVIGGAQYCHEDLRKTSTPLLQCLTLSLYGNLNPQPLLAVCAPAAGVPPGSSAAGEGVPCASDEVAAAALAAAGDAVVSLRPDCGDADAKGFTAQVVPLSAT